VTSKVNIFRRNERKGITYVARGTNTNERDNLDLATLLSSNFIGKFKLMQWENNSLHSLPNWNIVIARC
jgi:hypothetical protein